MARSNSLSSCTKSVTKTNMKKLPAGTEQKGRDEKLRGKQRVVMSALSDGNALSEGRLEKNGGSRNEHLGSTRPSTRPRDKDIRAQRLDAALDVLSAACTSTGWRTTGSTNTEGSTRHADWSIITSMSACVEKCPLTMRHIAKRSGDSCGESQRLSFGGTAAQRPKRKAKPRQHLAGPAAGVREIKLSPSALHSEWRQELRTTREHQRRCVRHSRCCVGHSRRRRSILDGQR